jgi:hypothetical protein
MTFCGRSFFLDDPGPDCSPPEQVGIGLALSPEQDFRRRTGCARGDAVRGLLLNGAVFTDYGWIPAPGISSTLKMAGLF